MPDIFGYAALIALVLAADWFWSLVGKVRKHEERIKELERRLDNMSLHSGRISRLEKAIKKDSHDGAGGPS